MKTSLYQASFDEMPIVLNMAKLYRYDLSEFMEWSVEPDGMYYCYELETYWENQNYPFIIRVNNELAGFALVSRSSDKIKASYTIGEFFVLRKFRKFGVGRKVALDIFNKFKGEWEVKQLINNKPAIIFWEKLISNYTNKMHTIHNVQDSQYGNINVIKFSNIEQ